ACASTPNQCKTSTVAVATQRINVLVIGCSRRGGQGTAVKKKNTGKISARANPAPFQIYNPAIVVAATNRQIDHRMICGCQISWRAYSSRNPSTPSVPAVKNPVACRNGINSDRSAGSVAVLKYRRIPKPSASNGT